MKGKKIIGRLSRRGFLRATAAGVGLLATSGFRQTWAAPAVKVVDPELAEFEKAGIDWKQARGEHLTVMVIPALFFRVAQEFSPQFTKLTGVEVTWQVIPPVQLREKNVLDLSTKTGQFASVSTDPQYYPLYAVNNWIEDLGPYVDNPKLTNKEWLDLKDVFPVWLESTSHAGKLYGLPYDGETTNLYYRSDLYKAKGISVPQTFDELMEAAKKLHDPAKDVYGGNFGYHIRLINMYIWPSIFRAYGGEWFDKAGNPTINNKQGLEALTYYIEFLNKYAPPGVANWNWPESLDAFIGGRLAQTFLSTAIAPIMANPAKSKVVGKFGIARWPKGPTGKRVTSVWNWSFHINKAISPKAKVATWLWIQWMASKPMQIQSSYNYKGKEEPRACVNRISIWNDERYRKITEVTPGFVDTFLTSMREDTDLHWRPRVPQWPELGNILGIEVQRALAGQASPKEALDEANAKVAELMKRG